MNSSKQWIRRLSEFIGLRRWIHLFDEFICYAVDEFIDLVNSPASNSFLTKEQLKEFAEEYKTLNEWKKKSDFWNIKIEKIYAKHHDSKRGIKSACGASESD